MADKALVLADTGQRKLPPDRPPAEGHEERKKKTKLEEVPLAIMDEAMSDKEAEQPSEKTICSKTNANEDRAEGNASKYSSYRASLMGFNGVAHCNHIMEEDDLFANDDEISWKMPEPTDEMKKLMETYPVAPCTEEEYNEWCEPWNYALILTVLGMKFNLYVLRDHLIRLWGFSNFELIDLPNNYFVVRFQDQDLWRTHYKKVLYEGPWVIRQHCVIVQRWTPYFNPYHNALGRVATWVRIPDVPIHLYNKHCISRLGDRIGRTLKVDMNTLQESQNASPKIQRGKFVRICVELNLQKKLVPKVIAAGSIFNVEYEGLTLICFECGRFGHRREQCPHKCPQMEPRDDANQPLNQPPNLVSVNTPAMNVDDSFGPWMLVQRRNQRGRPQRSDFRNGKQLSSSTSKMTAKTESYGLKSRYAAIEDLENQEEILANPSPMKTVHGKDKSEARNDVSSLVKASVQGKRKDTAGKVLIKGNQSNSKQKVLYRPKMDNAGSNSSMGPQHVSGPQGNERLSPVGPHNTPGPEKNEDNMAINSGLICKAGPTSNDGQNITLGKAESSKTLGHSHDQTPSNNNALVLHEGQRKTSNKNIKGQRIHSVVHGSLDSSDVTLVPTVPRSC